MYFLFTWLFAYFLFTYLFTFIGHTPYYSASEISKKTMWSVYYLSIISYRFRYILRRMLVWPLKNPG